MDEFRFKIIHQDKSFRARVGEIHTPHGIIHTPAFVPVGTQGTVKSLAPEELANLGVELYFVNTYHIYLRPGMDVIGKFGGLHKFMNWNKPLITDSGGFQIFSLAREKLRPNIKNVNRIVMLNLFQHLKKYNITNEILKQVQDDIVNEENKESEVPHLVKITDDGVKFQSHWDGTKHMFTPEISMELQWQLGSDIHIAFDECPPYPITREYARKSLERTHAWAKRSLAAHIELRTKKSEQKLKNNQNSSQLAVRSSQKVTANSLLSTAHYQALYGVVQGSVYQDLREKSADFIGSMDFDGIAIGGVAVGESKQEMRDVCDWVIPRLVESKPRHLLGVGEIDDIFDIIERGVDTFDCVQPTRLARMGHILISNIKDQKSNIQFKNKNFLLDITKKIFALDTFPLDLTCTCYTCANFSRAYVHHLFRVRELLGYRLATIHNLNFILTLVSEIREHIRMGTYLQYKKQFLGL